MALPKLLQKLFQNNGAGTKLREDIIPIDTALSTTSTNAVQNKVINSSLDGKLSTSGGTMTGDISFAGDRTIYNATNKGGDVLIHTKGVSLHGSNTGWLDGATLLLRSSAHPDQKGRFALVSALSSSQNCVLDGYPDGKLTWGGHNIISVVAESYSANSWYRKYSDGWIEQGGVTYFPNGGKRLVITLPIAFSTYQYTITFCVNDNYDSWLYSAETTKFTVGKTQGASGINVSWYVCGK